MMSNGEADPPTVSTKIRRSMYLITSISILTHALSLVYSTMTTHTLSRAYVSIIVSSLATFYLSHSHLTIYGVSILGSLYLSMIKPYYTAQQLVYITALSGVLLFVFWKPIHSWGTIFHCLPGRIHASLVFGIVLIVLTRFFPLAIENIDAFFELAAQTAFSNPMTLFASLFSKFSLLTLILTIEAIVMMFLMRKKLQKIPLIGLLVLVGILINTGHKFKSFSDVCDRTHVDCQFHVLHASVLERPSIEDILTAIPPAIMLAIAILFEQFLFIEEFERRGRTLKSGGGTLGQVSNETKILAISNLVSGCLGGLPVCVNILATYENFSYNKLVGSDGTKWVSICQALLGLLYYTLLDPLVVNLPLFVFFIIAATPAIYFLQHAMALSFKNLPTIVIIALISTLTHPVIALVYACLVTIYEVAGLIKPALSQAMVQTGRDSSRPPSQQVAAPQVYGGQQEVKVQPQEVQQHRGDCVRVIDGDIPEEYQSQEVVIMYRLIGSLNFLNFYNHILSINKMIRSCQHPLLILSFEYAQIIDEESVSQLGIYVEAVREYGVRVIMTGLHRKVLQKMESDTYLAGMMQEERTMYQIRRPV